MNFIIEFKQGVHEIHKSTRINFKQRAVILKGIADLFQAIWFAKH